MMSENELNFKHSNYNFLTPQVYGILLGLWLFLIVVGKFISQNYVLPYRYQFHFLNFGFVLFVELDLLVLGLLLSNVPMLFLGALVFIWFALIVFMLFRKTRDLKGEF